MIDVSPTVASYGSPEGKFWELPGFLVERLEDDSLRVWIASPSGAPRARCSGWIGAEHDGPERGVTGARDSGLAGVPNVC